MVIIAIIIAIIIVFVFWKSRPIKNSHYLPQTVEIKEVINPENLPSIAEVIKGHTLSLSREPGQLGFHLYATISTNGKDLSNLKKIFINWSAWPGRYHSFRYNASDSNIVIQGDQIRIDVGSFNNSNGSKNFLNRTASSDIMKFDLLNYEPEHNDYEYEKDYTTQSIFCPCLSIKDLKQFKKGVHYFDS